MVAPCFLPEHGNQFHILATLRCPYCARSGLILQSFEKGELIEKFCAREIISYFWRKSSSMKKFIWLTIASAALALTACSPSPEEVAQKIHSGESLGHKDYQVMIEYCDNQILTQIDMLKGCAEMSPERADRAIDSMVMKISDEYPLTDLFITTLRNNFEEMSQSNRLGFDEYLLYEEEASELMKIPITGGDE